MMRFHFWRFEEYEVLFHCHYSQVHSDLKWLHQCGFVAWHLHHHHHHHATSTDFPLFCHPSLSSIASSWSSRLHPVSVQSCCRYILAGYPTLVHLCERVHRRLSLMSLSLLLLQCPTCLVCLIWMVFEIGGRWPYSCSFVRCCFQDLFNIALNILVQLLSSFFSINLVSVQEVHPYSNQQTLAIFSTVP